MSQAKKSKDDHIRGSEIPEPMHEQTANSADSTVEIIVDVESAAGFAAPHISNRIGAARGKSLVNEDWDNEEINAEIALEFEKLK